MRVARGCLAARWWHLFCSGPLAGPVQRHDWSGRLPENGRATYKRALIACSLYVDHYYDPNYKNQCETVYKSFAVEFGPRFIGLLFRNAIISTRMMVLNSELSVSQARRELDGDNDFAKASIAALEKIYRETNSLAAANRSRAATGNDRPAAPE